MANNATLDQRIRQWRQLIAIRDEMMEMGMNTAGVISELESLFQVPGVNFFLRVIADEQKDQGELVLSNISDHTLDTAENAQNLETSDSIASASVPGSNLIDTDWRSVLNQKSNHKFPLQVFSSTIEGCKRTYCDRQQYMIYDEKSTSFFIYENGILVSNAYGIIRLEMLVKVTTGKTSTYVAFHYSQYGLRVLEVNFRSGEVACEVLNILRSWNIEITAAGNE